jgi:hypothetical protein
MINLLRSEFFKLRTVRLNIWLPFGAVIGLVVITSLVGLLASDPEFFDNEDLMSLIGGFSILVAMMVGVGTSLGITSEFAHNTIRPTLAATPNRPKVFTAKAIVSVLVDLVCGRQRVDQRPRCECRSLWRRRITCFILRRDRPRRSACTLRIRPRAPVAERPCRRVDHHPLAVAD